MVRVVKEVRSGYVKGSLYEKRNCQGIYGQYERGEKGCDHVRNMREEKCSGVCEGGTIGRKWS